MNPPARHERPMAQSLYVEEAVTKGDVSKAIGWTRVQSRAMEVYPSNGSEYAIAGVIASDPLSLVRNRQPQPAALLERGQRWAIR
jgi:hypothetical protein